MSANESRPEDQEETFSDRTMRFWGTLLVATLIVGLTAYILSFALLAPGGAPMHRASASSVFYTRS
jgi:hypothetical protein